MKNRPDYDFSKHVKVPDTWIGKALAIPSAPAAEPRGFFLCSRRIAAATSIVLVLGLSIALYFYIRNIDVGSDTVIPSAPASVTSPTGEPQPPSSAVSPAPTQVEPTPPIPTEAPSHTSTQPSTIVPTVPSAEAPSFIATDAPTVPPVTVPTETPPPATEPVIPPTEPAPTSAEPTAPPATIAPPTVPQIVSPSEDPAPETEDHITLCVPVDDPVIQICESDADETIYCRIYSPSGYLIGDSNEYAPSHIAQTLWIGQTLYLYYIQPLPDDPYPAEAGPYRYVFYDSAGITLAQGYC